MLTSFSSRPTTLSSTVRYLSSIGTAIAVLGQPRVDGHDASEPRRVTGAIRVRNVAVDEVEPLPADHLREAVRHAAKERMVEPLAIAEHEVPQVGVVVSQDIDGLHPLQPIQQHTRFVSTLLILLCHNSNRSPQITSRPPLSSTMSRKDDNSFS